MDASSFDKLSRHVAATTSRRSVLKTALAFVVAGLGGTSLLDFAETEAQKKKRKKKKRCPSARRCGKRCCREGDRCADPATGTCVTGRGTCAAGANSCTTGVDINCNPGGPIACHCHQTKEGETACVNPFQFSSCSNCTTDAECAQPGFPPGMRCIDQTGVCNCAIQGFTSRCAPPCPKPT